MHPQAHLPFPHPKNRVWAEQKTPLPTNWFNRGMRHHLTLLWSCKISQNQSGTPMYFATQLFEDSIRTTSICPARIISLNEPLNTSSSAFLRIELRWFDCSWLILILMALPGNQTIRAQANEYFRWRRCRPPVYRTRQKSKIFREKDHACMKENICSSLYEISEDTREKGLRLS